MLPCIKLQTVVSGLPTPPMVRLDINSLQTQVKVKMFASAHLYPAAAGINRDGRRRSCDTPRN